MRICLIGIVALFVNIPCKYSVNIKRNNSVHRIYAFNNGYGIKTY